MFPSLILRKQWQAEQRNVRVDDIVVVVDTNAIRGKWCLGRVTEVYSGLDGRVWNIKVKTSTGEYTVADQLQKSLSFTQQKEMTETETLMIRAMPLWGQRICC